MCLQGPIRSRSLTKIRSISSHDEPVLGRSAFCCSRDAAVECGAPTTPNFPEPSPQAHGIRHSRITLRALVHGRCH